MESEPGVGSTFCFTASAEQEQKGSPSSLAVSNGSNTDPRAINIHQFARPPNCIIHSCGVFDHTRSLDCRASGIFRLPTVPTIPRAPLWRRPSRAPSVLSLRPSAANGDYDVSQVRARRLCSCGHAARTSFFGKPHHRFLRKDARPHGSGPECRRTSAAGSKLYSL